MKKKDIEKSYGFIERAGVSIEVEKLESAGKRGSETGGIYMLN